MCRLKLTVLVLALASFASACSDESAIDEEATAEAGRFGLVQVSFEHDWAASGPAALLTTTAQFVRYSVMQRDQVARLLALPLDPARDLPELDRCRIYDLSVDAVADEVDSLEQVADVELLEAGNLHIQTEGQAVNLTPRHFPWLLPFISGVVYGESQALAVENVGARVRATAEGGEAVGPFSVDVDTPELPRLISVGNHAPEPLIATERNQALALRWEVAALPAAEDVVYAELRYSRGKRDLALRCQLQDDGAFDVPQSLIAELDSRVTFEFARLRRIPFSVAGLEQAELRVAVRDTATLQLP